MTTRRGFIGTILALAAAPAIVRASSLDKIWVPLWQQQASRFSVFVPGRELLRPGVDFTVERGGVGDYTINFTVPLRNNEMAVAASSNIRELVFIKR